MAAANEEVPDSDTSAEPDIKGDYFTDLKAEHQN